MYSAIHIPTGETIQRGMNYRETEIAREICIWIDEIEFVDEIIETNQPSETSEF